MAGWVFGHEPPTELIERDDKIISDLYEARSAILPIVRG
jgi:hypothetical protein